MKALLTGIVVGALAATAFNNTKSSTRTMMKKGKRAILKKFDDMLNI